MTLVHVSVGFFGQYFPLHSRHRQVDQIRALWPPKSTC